MSKAAERFLDKFVRTTNYRFIFSIIVLGIIFAAIADWKLASVLKIVFSVLGTVLLTAGIVKLFDLVTLKSDYLSYIYNQVAEKFTKINKDTIQNACLNCKNIRGDCSKLGLMRIYSNIKEIKRDYSISDLVAGAEEVYIMGTALKISSQDSEPIIRANPKTKFRYIQVRLPENDKELYISKALAKIHNDPVSQRTQIESALEAFEHIAAKYKNVCLQTISFIPTLSVILAKGSNDSENKTWGRMQVMHYLFNSAPEEQIWLYLEHNGIESELFTRYREMVERIWKDSKQFDLENKSCTIPPDCHDLK